MKPHEARLLGWIDTKGRLMVPQAELKEFTKLYSNKRVIVSVKVYHPGTSAALRGYYYNYVVKAVAEGYWAAGERLTYEETEKRLRDMSPITHNWSVDEDTGKMEYELRPISDLDNEELIEHIEIIKQFAAEDLGVYIADPQTI